MTDPLTRQLLAADLPPPAGRVDAPAVFRRATRRARRRHAAAGLLGLLLVAGVALAVIAHPRPPAAVVVATPPPPSPAPAPPSFAADDIDAQLARAEAAAMLLEVGIRQAAGEGSRQRSRETFTLVHDSFSNSPEAHRAAVFLQEKP